MKNNNREYYDLSGNPMTKMQFRIYERVLKKVKENNNYIKNNEQFLELENRTSSLVRCFNFSKEYRQNFYTTINPNGTFYITTRNSIRKKSLEECSV